MSIGTTIKNLRRKHDMTQEQLAELLGLTPAAISGWENDRNAPDISQIPLLCNIFCISADVLLGIDLTAQDRKIDELIANAQSGCAKDAVSIYRIGLAEFPASCRLMLGLADNLDYSDEPETYNARITEQIALYEKIRESAKDAYYKNCAEGRLCSIYLRQGKRDKAVGIAEGVPRLQYSREDLDRMLAQGEDKIYEIHHKIRCEFAELCDDIYSFALQQNDNKPLFSHQKSIMMLEKIIKMNEVFYENEDYLDANGILAWAYTRIAEHYADMQNGIDAVECLKSAAKYAKDMDLYFKGLQGPYGFTDVWDYPLFPAEKRHTSVLADPKLDYPTTTVWFNTSGETSYMELLKKDLAHSRFDFIRSAIPELI